VKAPLQLFDTLEQLRVPTHLSVDAGGHVAAMCAPAEGPGASIHLVDVASGATTVFEPAPGYTYDQTRIGAGGGLVAACGLVDAELEVVVSIDTRTGAHLREVAVDGAIEDLVELRDGIWVVRVADPGSERDGMHLGTRVGGVGDVLVLPPQRRWRRLVVVDLHTGRTTPLATDGWTIWDHDAAGETVLAVASSEPSPAGYYQPALISVGFETAVVEVIHTSSRQLARPRLGDDGRTAMVIEGRSIVSGRVRRFDLTSGSDQLLDDLDDVTDITIADRRIWYTGWSDRGAFIATAPTPRDASSGADLVSIRLDATLHGRDAQPSVTPLSDQRCLVVIDEVDAPAEVAVVDLAEGSIRRLTQFNTQLANTIARPSERAVSWQAPDGEEIHGVVILPAGIDRPAPLIVMVHGGPTWLWSTAYSPAESNQLALPFVAAGAAVLLANPRGSSGRGTDFADAVTGKLGDIDASDLLRGIDHLVAAEVADPARVSMIGTSYGGYMSGWIAATTSRLRCAVAMSCVADWCSFATTSAIGGGFDTTYFPGADITTPEGREQLAAASTVFHAANTTTPLLVIHGGHDRVTPIGQADALVHAWHRAGAPVEQVVFPHEGHEFVDSASRRDTARRVLEFMQRHGILG
jgi:dipeptidyl aminopeptidase/acylaminoacyl peptidase